VDPSSGIVYMTEDQADGLLYRFLPENPGRLGEGGRSPPLRLVAVSDRRSTDGSALEVGRWHESAWLDLDDVDAPEDDLRQRGAAAGATVFSRGEGLHMGEGEVYFCCTDGGAAGLGQIFRLRPGSQGGDRLQLFFESTSPEQFNF